jgi:outer membrane protein assembly factor BamB
MLVLVLLWAGRSDAQGVNVLTHHNDNARTGANLSEQRLNTTSVASDGFGLLSSLAVDGQIYAQPLYVSTLPFPDGSLHNVVYLATMHNSVYAVDADTLAILWSEQLGLPVNADFMPMSPARESADVTKIINCTPTDKKTTGGPHNIFPEIGITSTPVIDLGSQTIYVVPKVTVDGQFYYYLLHALDLRTGAERAGSPAMITANVPSTAKDSHSLILTFIPKNHLQRPALLLANGRVYVAFGAHQDTPPYHGWVIAYDAKTLKQTGAYVTTPNGEEGGIWQSGSGPAADEKGNIYFMVGNGTFGQTSQAGSDLGDSFVKLNPDLALLDWFTPHNFQNMADNDIDLGSSGPMLMPGTSLLIGGDKHGRFYLINRDKMGHLGTDDNAHPPVQDFQAAADPNPTFNTCGFDYHNIHGAPVIWNTPTNEPLIYVWAERDYLKAFRYSSATHFFILPPSYQSTMKDPDGGAVNVKEMPGGMLSLSANGTQAGTGVLWASLPLVGSATVDVAPGILRAFDAENVGHELWCTSTGSVAKFTPPTIANGKVYLASLDNHLYVYGMGAHKEPRFRANYKTHSRPFGYQGHIYFQGTDDKLWQVLVDGSGGVNLGGFKTKSAPFVADGYVYFEGTDGKLWKVSVSDPQNDRTNLGGFKTSSMPFVDQGVVYFRGTDDKLWRVNSDGTGATQLGGFKTQSSPFVSGGYIYFQGTGTDNKLWKVSVTDPQHDRTNLGGYHTKSTPTVANGHVYFQGTDDKLWKVSINNPTVDATNLNKLKTSSSPFVNQEFIYFRGTDNRLWRMYTDGSGRTSPGCDAGTNWSGNWTQDSPFVYGDKVYFRGTDDRLLVAWARE